MTFKDEPIIELMMDEEEDIEIDVSSFNSTNSHSSSEIISPVIRVDFDCNPSDSHSKLYSNFRNRGNNKRQIEERPISPSLDSNMNHRFIKSTSPLFKEPTPNQTDASLISILEPTEQLINKLDANVTTDSVSIEQNKTQNLTSWSCLSLSTKGVRPALADDSNTKSKQRLVGLVRPIIPQRTTSLSNKDNLKVNKKKNMITDEVNNNSDGNIGNISI